MKKLMVSALAVLVAFVAGTSYVVLPGEDSGSATASISPAVLAGIEASFMGLGELSPAEFQPRLTDAQAIAIARAHARDRGKMTDVDSLPVKTTVGRYSGNQYGPGEPVQGVEVRVVVFDDLNQSLPSMPDGYTGPAPADPKYTVLINDATGEVVMDQHTWGYAK